MLMNCIFLMLYPISKRVLLTEIHAVRIFIVKNLYDTSF